MKCVTQTKLANQQNINEATMRDIIGVALEYNPNFVLNFGRNVLLPESSEKIVEEIIGIKESMGLSYLNSTRFYFTEFNTEIKCKTCVQYEKEIERLNRVLRLSNKAI